MRQISEYNTNAALLDRTKRNLVRAMNEDITPRQREMLTLYYAQRMSMTAIGAQLGVDKSTVSRTIRRGTHRLRRILRYGAEVFLNADGGREAEG